MENQHTKKLKTILNSKIFYIVFVLITIFITTIQLLLNKNTSAYEKSEKNFNVKITNYKIDNNKLSLELLGKEPLIGTYYFNNEEEKNTIINKIEYGNKLEITGTLSTPLNNTVPNTFNYKTYLENKDIHYTLSIESIKFISDDTSIIYKIKNIIAKRINSIDKKGYIKAFILGDKSNIDNNKYNSYQKIGITHLFALSGMHVGLLSGIMLKLFKKCSNKKYLLIDVFLIFYGLLVGFPSSIKRCILFFILNSLNKLLKTEISNLKIILITISLLIIFDYKIIFDVGFRYSVFTVFGIILSNSYISSKSKILTSLKLSLVAFLFSLPITLTNFYEINLLSIFYNIIYVPFISIIVYPLSLVTFIFPFFYNIFDMTIYILENSTILLSKINIFNLYLDFNFIEVIIFYLFLYLLFYTRKKIACFGIIFIILIDITIPYFDSKAYLYFFDVGQGDSSLIIGPYQKDVILIDTGGIVNFSNYSSDYMVSDNVITFLKSKGIKEIDLLILSHGDADHAKEVGNIYQEIKINSLKLNPGEVGYYEQIALDLIKEQNYIPQNIDLSFLNYKDYNDENANSLLTLINIYNTKIISFGDATKEAEEDIITKYDLKDIDIAKISHHGSKTSSSKKYLSTINPQIAVISSGRNNRFNHPSQETIDTLNSLKITYLNTQESGTIEFVISKNNVTIKEYKP